MRTLLTRWRQDRRGVSAVEFALIAPVMIATLMATIELPRAFSYSQKLNRATRAMADLIARDNLASLDDIYAAGQAIAQPLQAANAGMRLTALGVYTGGVAKVCSADGRGMAARPVGSNLGAAPPAFATPGSRYVMAEVSLPYVPVFPIFPGLKNLVLNRNAIWPIRKGTPYNADPEVILPGGVKCPST